MLINKPGAEFLYNGITYRIGDVIIGSDQSEYAGLIGSILKSVTAATKKPKTILRTSTAPLILRYYQRTSQRLKQCSRTCMARKRYWMTFALIWSLWLRK